MLDSARLLPERSHSVAHGRCGHPPSVSSWERAATLLSCFTTHLHLGHRFVGRAGGSGDGITLCRIPLLFGRLQRCHHLRKARIAVRQLRPRVLRLLHL